MSAEASVEAVAPSLNLTPEEKRAYGQLFRQADTGNAGIVTGEVAVNFFDKTKLDSRVLGEIWQIADKENRGFLTPAGFGIVLRLIGHAQAGREPTAALALEPAPLPRFDGFVTSQPTGPQAPPAPIQAQGTGGQLRIPPLTPDKVAQYSGLFERQPLQNGTLPGDQAKQIFEKSGLPNEVLGRIWMLADTEQRGALVQAEFIIAMHLLTSLKTGSLRALPNVLPAPLYEAATRHGSVALRQSPQTTGIPAIPRQMSGSSQPRTGSPLGRPPIGPQGTGQNGGDWLVTPADKAKFDQIFGDLDRGNKGYITGEEAVPFFSQSNLPEDSLAQIWDLSDILSRGQLGRDEFAVAMYLIRQLRGNRSNTLPTALPQSLIPPSLRNRSQNIASAFDPPAPAAPAPPQHKSAMDDLFGLDSTAPSPIPAPAFNEPQPTGGSTASDPFAGGAPSSPIRPATSNNTFKPFVPSSSFGRGLTHHGTGDSTPSSSQLPTQSGGDDLLGDNDPEISKKLTSESTELANLSNQITSLSKQMQDTQAKRTVTQNELGAANSQKQNFEQRLSQLRTLYEKEVADTRALEEQLRNARSDTKKLQGECLTLEGTYSDIQTQHQQVLAALQADQQENGNLRERIRVVNGEIAQLKPQIEKLKSEARQQKGLVAINKKQLSTTESERDKLKSEAEELTKSNEEASRQVSAGSPASPSAKIASPALSTASGNNPFFNRTASTDIMGTFASPPPRNFSETTFDDVFGPSEPPARSSASPPPPTSFKTFPPETSAGSVGSAATPPASSPKVSRAATLTNDPPAPPESRQINSSFLPFPEAPESLTSSRQVSPPASRAEGSGSESTYPPFPTGNTQPPVTTKVEPADEEDEKKDPPTASAAAATTVVNAPDGAVESAKTSDPFGNMDQAKAKEDFDNAFAAFSSSKSQDAWKEKSGEEAPKARSAFSAEFPPISSLERDDYSDSDSENGGFEDDFAPASSAQKKAAETKPALPGSFPSETAFADVGSSAPPKEPVDKSATEPSSSTATITNPNTTTTGTHQSTVDDIFGSAATGEAPSTQQAVPSKPPAKGTYDDLSDFEGLEDAKEGSADDDFANISRSGLDDFNPMFDNSPPASQAKSESTAFGNESSFDFISANSAAGASAAGSGTQPKAGDNNDWDAIFSSLDSPSAAAAVPAANNESGKVDSSNNNSGNLSVDRPGIGRALTEEGHHDDPILKDLISMGYQRSAALSALEKYDYNLERAANYLASQS